VGGYPAHDSNTNTPRATKKKPGGSDEVGPVPCGRPMMLPEQTVRAERLGHLFCVGCNALVPAAEFEIEEAQRAARADGWTFPKGPAAVVPGTLDPDVRACLYFRLRAEESIGKESEAATKQADATKAGPTLVAMGFLVDDLLTDEGRRLARAIVSPLVPASAIEAPTPEGTARYAKAAKALEKKPRKPRAPKVTAPMVCTCGHGAAEHTGTRMGPKGLEPCDVRCKGSAGSCSCMKYRQAKPEKPAKEGAAA